VSVHPQVRVVVRPYGSPVPLGFFAFGIGMFLYAALGAGWVKPADQHTVGMLLALFVFPLQIVATVFAYLARDGAAGTALGLFSTSWLAGGVLLATATPGTLDRADGFYLIAFTIVILLLAGASIAGRPLLAAFLIVSSCRSLTSAVYELGGGRGWDTVAGWFAFASFVIALYGGMAFLLEDTLGRTLLPLARTGVARTAIESGLEDQLSAVEDEAGVRRRL
jgi:uncharacterized protein